MGKIIVFDTFGSSYRVVRKSKGPKHRDTTDNFLQAYIFLRDIFILMNVLEADQRDASIHNLSAGSVSASSEINEGSFSR